MSDLVGRGTDEHRTGLPASGAPTLVEILGSLPADPPAVWPAVPPNPTHPGPGWERRPTEGTGYLIWTQPLAPGTDVGRWWSDHRGRYEQTGLWPLLVDDTFWDSVELGAPDDPAPSEATAVLRRLAAAYFDDRDVEHGPAPEPVVDDRATAQVIDDTAEFSTLVLVPTRCGWSVPALLGWDGSANYGISGAEHTAVLGRWAHLYGAELYALTRDVVMLAVSRPPTGAHPRLQAAAELCAYCPDAVDQGAGTLEALTSMAGSSGWWLWWD